MRPSQLQRDIKQNRPFQTAGQEATLALLRTADQVRRRISAVIEPFGVTPQQYNVLRILRGAMPRGLATLDIAERLIEQTPGITRLCDCLERRALLTRTRSADDRRVVMCQISTAGLRLLATMDQPVAAADRLAIGALTASEVRSLIGLLDKVRRAPTTHPNTQRT